MPFHRSCQELSWEMAQNLKLDNITRLDWRMWKSDIWPGHLNKFKINKKCNIIIQWIKEMWISLSGGYPKKWESPNTGTNQCWVILRFWTKTLLEVRPGGGQNLEDPPTAPNTGTNLHNWVLGLTSKKINSSLQQKRISNEFLILGVSSVRLGSTSHAEAKRAHKGEV
jgi:hypothetical protein